MSTTASAIRRFITALVTPFQALEDTIQALILQRNVNYAVGVQLDQLGELVGQPRQGIADDEIYRRYVRARIATNKSDGQPETIYRIARIVLGDTEHTLEIDNQGAATYVLRVLGEPLSEAIADILISFLRQAASAGVRVILEYTEEDVETIGRWSTQGTWGSALWAHGRDE